MEMQDGKRQGEEETTALNGAYESFAMVYDTFMDNVPYEKWANEYEQILSQYGIRDGLILDLGCGTGNMTLQFQKKGFDMIGVDLSLDMLEIAREKSMGTNILYLQQDMCEFELYGTVRAVICVCDSLNYILEPDQLSQIFSLVDNYLDPGGIFLFDFNTDYKYRELIGDRVIAEDREDMSFIWDNYYDEETRRNEYALSIFLREKGNLFRKYEELHTQRGYSLKEMKEALFSAGLEFLFARDGEEGGPVLEESGRILVAAREQKKGKGDLR
ncbi:MAG: class I SAM-dependent methyltransferase [Lachnospiraceae bacterium]|nr:class I SAM-dependent methyltransferase [Lachnospiraceae bacterium]